MGFRRSGENVRATFVGGMDGNIVIVSKPKMVVVAKEPLLTNISTTLAAVPAIHRCCSCQLQSGCQDENEDVSTCRAYQRRDPAWQTLACS